MMEEQRIAIFQTVGGNSESHGYDRNAFAKRYLKKNPAVKVTRRQVSEEDFEPVL